MDNNQVEQIIAWNAGSKIPFYGIQELREKLVSMDYGTASAYMAQLKDPTISIILSVLAGVLGLDRFYIGDTGLGVLKLITCGGLGIWWIVDLFLIMGITKNRNMEQIRNMTATL